MSTQTVFLTANTPSQTVDIALVQKAAAAAPGDPITGLAFNTASLTAYQRSGPTSTPAAIALASQTVGGAWTSGGFVELDATHTPGEYRFDVPNALLSVVGESNVTFTGAANLATHTLKIIVTGMDFYSTLVGQLSFLAMTESYAPVGSPASPVQAAYLQQQLLTSFSIVGTTLTVKKLDGVTTAATFTLNDPVNPSAMTRTS